MSGDLISRAALIERIENIDWYSTNDNGVLHSGAVNEESAYIRYADVARVVENALAVEAEPVVHARWTFESLIQIAPNCGNCKMQSIMRYPRCPHCGAHMDEEVADE
jgi:hypothetical protein